MRSTQGQQWLWYPGLRSLAVYVDTGLPYKTCRAAVPITVLLRSHGQRHTISRNKYIPGGSVTPMGDGFYSKKL